ncbi:MAG: DUF374 domain-containing protein [Proteobacteria bacterium]|nr:DUF374 domain-containing protein [Pseudomonadota bacterium]MCP4920194.1 DUF374 domain-containing protein [Pseudomonadota bacterium]
MLAAVVAFLLRVFAVTWRVHTPGREAIPPAVVYAFLHGDLLPLTLIHRDEGVVGMVSQSRDGERLTPILERLGYAVVRGSSSRGGPQAREDASRVNGAVALAVDGPRGPAGVPKPGAARIALERQVPLVCVRLRAPASIRLGSWDSFRIPLPFARLDVEYEVLAPTGSVEQLTDRIAAALVVDSGA